MTIRLIPLLPCALMALVAGCVAPSGGTAHADTSLDGTYDGTATDDPACGTAVHSIRLHVASGRIWLHSRHKRRELEGSVGADGQLVMQDSRGVRHVQGAIVGSRLGAVETADETAGRVGLAAIDQARGAPCETRIVAFRQ